MKKIRLRAGLEYVKCCELAELIAYALWPDDGTDDESWEINHGTCRMHSEARIKQAAQSGSLPLKHPSSFESLEWTSGQAWKLGLVTINDLRAYVADRGITVVVGDAPEQADTKPQPTPEPTPTGTATVWTLERKTEARAMLNKLRFKGVRDFARRTADAFNVSPTRLNAVLAEKKPKEKPKEKASFWLT